jgi:hypothetical protein
MENVVELDRPTHGSVEVEGGGVRSGVEETARAKKDYK